VRSRTLDDRRRLYQLALIAIRRHYDLPLTLEALARGLGSSRRQLQRAFAQFSRRSFHEELTEERMRVAAQLLLRRELSVAAVARSVGYRHVPSFAAAFRRRHGASPGRFRSQAHARSPGAAAGARVSHREPAARMTAGATQAGE
jgi:AraC-like DNA-binding protein